MDPINSETRNIVDNPVEKVLQSGEIVGIANHTVLISRNGQEYQIADSAAPIRDDEGNIDGVVLVFRDVTENYKKEQELRERVKELDCLYKLAQIEEEPNASLSYILKQTAEVVPQSWQYPETCECRITLDTQIFRTTAFSETKWKQSSDIVINGVIRGAVTVCYLDKKPDAHEGPFLKEERRLLDAIAERLGKMIERIQADESLRSIEWMLSNKSLKKKDYFPEYGDVSELNKDGLILSSVGKEQLRAIASEYLDLLETSTAIYEKNGDYALGIFTSGWCQLMDSASRRLCRTEDNQKAIESGEWLCHESCWKDALLSIKEDKPVEIECNGGIKMYAVPIRANGKIVGAMNFGYGNPPTEESELRKLSEMYNIPVDELRKQAEAYRPRPQFIIDYAKERIEKAAKYLAHLIEQKQTEEDLRNSVHDRNFLMKELNHRVKNNLAMVSSLISLKDSETRDDLSDLKHRIDVIKLVHEKLHKQNEVEEIEVKEYFQELLDSIFSSVSELAVNLVSNIDEVSISTRTAIPLGLVINEIATNAMKYGFSSDDEARFTIEMTRDSKNRQYILTLSNTGHPFPDDIGLQNPETMGLQLVSTLVNQINGTIELQKKPNPVFTIRFPMEKNRW